MRPDDLLGHKFKSKCDEVRRYWQKTLSTIPHLNTEIGNSAGARVLVSPIGHARGVLYSAIAAASEGGKAPGVCVAICSDATGPTIDEALAAARFTGQVKRLTLHDAHGGVKELKGLERAAKVDLATASEVFVNVTGGTTLMGAAAERLAALAARFARPVQRFALIDKRTVEEQKLRPYVQGERILLDPEENDDRPD